MYGQKYERQGYLDMLGETQNGNNRRLPLNIHHYKAVVVDMCVGYYSNLNLAQQCVDETCVGEGELRRKVRLGGAGTKPWAEVMMVVGRSYVLDTVKGKTWARETGAEVSEMVGEEDGQG